MRWRAVGYLERALPSLLARDGAHQGRAVVRVDPRVLDGTGDTHIKLPAVDQLLGV
jgi:hypothetical protein